MSEAPERQAASCQSFCESKGWTVVGVFEDRNISAYGRTRRDAYENLLAEVRAGRVEKVVVWKLDRLTREGIRGVGKLLDILDSTGASLVSAVEGFDTAEGGHSELLLSVLASVARQESHNTSVRVRAANADSARKGRPHAGGARCFGYGLRSADGSFEVRPDGLLRGGTDVVPDEAASLREARDRLLAGESLRAIAIALNDKGVRTTRGNHWSGPTVRQALLADRLSGIRVMGGTEYPLADWSPIFTREEHVELKALLHDPSRLSRKLGRRYLLTGQILCGLCESPLKFMPFHGRRGGVFPRYACVRQPGRPHCGHLAASMRGVDEHVTRLLLAAALDAEADSNPATGNTEDLTMALDRMGVLRKELLERRFVDAAISDEEFLSARAAQDERVADLERKLAAAGRSSPPALPRTYPEMLAWWEKADIAARREVVELFIDAVIIYPAARRGGNRFDAGRVEVRWR